MSRIRGVNTAPELLVRSILHKLGLRFRLHVSKLPGKPDIVLPKYRTAIFVHGCFWHQHPGCPNARMPKANRAYWEPKLYANVLRFNKQTKALHNAGWIVHVVWECETKKPEALEHSLIKFFQKLRTKNEKSSIMRT